MNKDFSDIKDFINDETIIPNFKDIFFLEKDEMGNLIIANSFIEFSVN